MRYVPRQPSRRISDSATGSETPLARSATTWAKGSPGYRSGDIVQFFTYALASIAEVKDYLVESCTRGAITQSDMARLIDHCDHTRAMSLRFMKPHAARLRRKSKARST
jgi:hypothetical protein